MADPTTYCDFHVLRRTKAFFPVGGHDGRRLTNMAPPTHRRAYRLCPSGRSGPDLFQRLKCSTLDLRLSDRTRLRQSQSHNMDKKTIDAYSELAKNYSEDWLAQPQPSDMYELLKTFFVPGGKTADIGCGNGRDTHWLEQNGFKVSGFDSSSELLAIASELFPNTKFKQAFLPELKGLDEKYQNILCETVIMHLPKVQVPTAILSLKRILSNDGVLYLSWRVTEGEDTRHSDGRLYSAFEPDVILNQFDRERILHFEDKISASSGKRVCRLIYRGKTL